MNRIRGESFRTTTVCIDSYTGGVLCGHFYNPCMKTHQVFGSTTQFLLEMEKMLDELDLPKSFSLMRSFLPVADSPPNPLETEACTGRKATFSIRILFRQNSSWQGSITWLEGQCEQSFRSVLELILLMDNALTTEIAS